MRRYRFSLHPLLPPACEHVLTPSICPPVHLPAYVRLLLPPPLLQELTARTGFGQEPSRFWSALKPTTAMQLVDDGTKDHVTNPAFWPVIMNFSGHSGDQPTARLYLESVDLNPVLPLELCDSLEASILAGSATAVAEANALKTFAFPDNGVLTRRRNSSAAAVVFPNVPECFVGRLVQPGSTKIKMKVLIIVDVSKGNKVDVDRTTHLHNELVKHEKAEVGFCRYVQTSAACSWCPRKRMVTATDAPCSTR